MQGFSINLPVSGATTYQWISGEELSSSTNPNPVVNPVTDTRYKVVGYDAYNCFTDTAEVMVLVRNCPPWMLALTFDSQLASRCN